MELSAALPILRALANGINPVTGLPLAEDAPYSEPRTLRAIFTSVGLVEREVEREKRLERLPKNFGKPWSEEEDATLRGHFESGATMQEIARKHGRTVAGCRLRLEKLGVIAPSPAQDESPRLQGS